MARGSHSTFTLRCTRCLAQLLSAWGPSISIRKKQYGPTIIVKQISLGVSPAASLSLPTRAAGTRSHEVVPSCMQREQLHTHPPRDKTSQLPVQPATRFCKRRDYVSVSFCHGRRSGCTSPSNSSPSRLRNQDPSADKTVASGYGFFRGHCAFEYLSAFLNVCQSPCSPKPGVADSNFSRMVWEASRTLLPPPGSCLHLLDLGFNHYFQCLRRSYQRTVQSRIEDNVQI
ncbi:hypothetical protein BU26DRAFT_10287 [Trematosphaeria pertusa]|uniref:Uncharacterized protein n=1 Tax=Trematosphaeria pertusa TaxID=390896 RepID=A0A6A6IZL1_9PLEO|nr:uncharacterized protein BU26DRAFT_10287 [Trematosphaeria pertusa]KAF2255879.1 hypothetical protein BU26DRAFT_10287 [Trematosphaeria pertusa]